ncbi:MAG TPA: helix-turn-helix transcriptional regulator [Spirochaetota bacterium]|nr:helix-turn-helix transcriptional regulator [Spirochaetota bacterium]HQO02794.1 helix-turn-helix transcriptional regulator [Spirochaetota bacterium]HQP49848.1 helix-turn-helix transcriptional regulator [Spirochaetota bacterium]
MGFKKIGKKIQLAREAKGLTQSDLAEKLAITQAALSNYELGKRRLYLHQIQKLAEILDKHLNYFIDDESIDRYTGAGQDISNKKIPLSNEEIMTRICALTGEETQLLSEFLDFLEWRKNKND